MKSSSQTQRFATQTSQLPHYGIASPQIGSSKASASKATVANTGTTLAFQSQNNPVLTTSAGSEKR